MSLMPKPKLRFPPLTDIPVKQMLHPYWTTAKQLVLGPHVLFSQMYHHRRAASDKFICPGNDDCNEFWDEVVDCPELSHPSYADRPEYKRWGVPIRFYGDGTPLKALGNSWAKMLDAFHWTSCLCGRGKSVLRCFPIWFFYQTLMANVDGHATYKDFSQKLAWSFTALWTGKFPLCDEHGVPYPVGSWGHKLAIKVVYSVVFFLVSSLFVKEI